jgi:hypothetical protein
MNDTSIELDNTEEDQIFAYQASDEALEAAADMGNGKVQNFTHHGCTFTPYCPG